jgi:hypothetical protein
MLLQIDIDNFFYSDRDLVFDAHRRNLVPILHSSAIFIETLERIRTTHLRRSEQGEEEEEEEEDEVQLQILVALYWLESDSKLVLREGTFVDQDRIREIVYSRRSNSTTPALDGTIEIVIEYLQIPIVKTKLEQVSQSFFDRRLSVRSLIDLIDGLLREVRFSLSLITGIHSLSFDR